MKIAWITFQLLSLGMIIFGSIYALYNKEVGLPVCFMGIISLVMSSSLRPSVFKKQRINLSKM